VIPGAHVSVTGGIHTAIDRAESIGAESVQVFTQSPRTWRPTNHDPANFERFKERRAEAGIQGVVCHAVYLLNLAAPDDAVYEKSVAALLNTVEVGCAIEADGVVFHVGSHLGAGLEAGLERALPVDVTDAGALDACLDEVDERIGLDRLNALHVNDAAAELGSNRDRHANVGEGALGTQHATPARNLCLGRSLGEPAT
jgi:deoxyribonuclease-4